jgi:glutathione S-transferase
MIDSLVVADPVLITIPISHFCEKARWELDRAGIAYDERPHVQVIHRFAARRAGGGTTVPVLVRGNGSVLTESAQIVDYADSRSPSDRRLYPMAGEAADEIRNFERGLDEGFGPDGRLWMYHVLRGHRKVAARYATTGVPGWERRAFPAFYPVMSRVIDRFFDINDESAAEALRRVRSTFDEIAVRLADRRPYLMGGHFSAADLTFSALAAPVLVPTEYGVPLPQPDELPDAMAAVVRELREHPAGQHALRMYRDERR